MTVLFNPSKSARLAGLLVYAGLATILVAVPIALGAVLLSLSLGSTWWQTLCWGFGAIAASTLGGIAMLCTGLYVEGRSSE